MGEPESQDRLNTRCPECGAAYAVRRDNLGRRAKCRKCGTVFVMAEDAAADIDVVTDGLLCPVCQTTVAESEDAKACPACGARHHPDCWEYNKGCGMYGCDEAPPTEKLDSLEIAPSWWGREDKECPACHHVILAAAKRCKHCGAMFESERPQDTSEYFAGNMRRRALPEVAKGALMLLIFGLIPCTAPFAAIFGGIWYANHRAEINDLPAMKGSMAKIGLWVAVGQTALGILMGLLVSVFS